MAIKIVLSDTVAVSVEGSLVGEHGPEPFQFTLLCQRLSSEQLQERLSGEGSMIDFVAGVSTGWRSVRGPDGEEPFSEPALRRLLQVPNLAKLAFDAYIRDVGAKAKN